MVVLCLFVVAVGVPTAAARERVEGPTRALQGCHPPKLWAHERVAMIGGSRAALMTVETADRDGSTYGASFACDRRTGRVKVLQDDVLMDRDLTAFSGHLAAYRSEDEDIESICFGIAIVDVATGRSHEMTGGCGSTSEEAPAYSKLALHGSGAIAFTGRLNDASPAGVFVVLPQTREAGFPLQMRIAGPGGLSKRSLHATRSGFCWTQHRHERCVRAPRLHRCVPAGARLIARSAWLVVVSTEAHSELCNRVTGRRWLLDGSQLRYEDRALHPDSIQLRGPFAAMRFTAYEGDVESEEIVVIDGRGGHVRARDSTYVGGLGPSLLLSDGALAYVAHRHDTPVARTELLAIDRSGRRVLDASADDIGALRSDGGGYVRWTSHGEPRLARIHGAGPRGPTLKRCPTARSCSDP